MKDPTIEISDAEEFYSYRPEEITLEQIEETQKKLEIASQYLQKTERDNMILSLSGWMSLLSMLLDKKDDIERVSGKSIIDLLDGAEPDGSIMKGSELDRALKALTPTFLGAPKKDVLTEHYLMTALRNEDHKSPVINADEAASLAFRKDGKRYTIIADIKSADKNLTSISEYASRVLDVLYSMIREGQRQKIDKVLVSPASIYRAMINDTEKGYPGKKKEKEIESIIEQLRAINVDLDITEYLISKGIAKDTDEPVTINDTLIRAARLKQGENVRYILEKGPILEYLEKSGGVIDMDPKHWNIQKIGQNNTLEEKTYSYTEERIAAAQYLTRRIARMKKQKRNAKLTRVILFDTLFEQLMVSDKNAKTDIRKFSIACLENWKTRGEFTDYVLRKKGKAAEGVEIII